MKLLLTSGGLMNKSMTDALAAVLGKPFSESKVVFIPTAASAERGNKNWLVKDFSMAFDLGWKEFDIIDLAAVAGLEREKWWPALEQADAYIVGGGNTFFLSYWMQQTGFMQALPELLKTKVYVGISAGSIVVSNGVQTSTQIEGSFMDEEYQRMSPKKEVSNKTAQLVKLAVRPHYKSPIFPTITEEGLQKVASNLDVPMYAIDDQTALQVIDGDVKVISEGEWKLFND